MGDFWAELRGMGWMKGVGRRGGGDMAFFFLYSDRCACIVRIPISLSIIVFYFAACVTFDRKLCHTLVIHPPAKSRHQCNLCSDLMNSFLLFPKKGKFSISIKPLTLFQIPSLLRKSPIVFTLFGIFLIARFGSSFAAFFGVGPFIAAFLTFQAGAIILLPFFPSAPFIRFPFILLIPLSFHTPLPFIPSFRLPLILPCPP